jgi:hypothetical protein
MVAVGVRVALRDKAAAAVAGYYPRALRVPLPVAMGVLQMAALQLVLQAHSVVELAAMPQRLVENPGMAEVEEAGQQELLAAIHFGVAVVAEEVVRELLEAHRSWVAQEEPLLARQEPLRVVAAGEMR